MSEASLPSKTTDPAVDSVVDVEKALKLRLAGWTYVDIAHKFGVTKQSIHKRLQKFARLLADPGAIKSYRENEPELLDAVRMEIVGHMADPATLKKASLNNCAFAFTQLLQGARLVRGESTANIHQLTAIIEAAHAPPVEPAEQGASVGASGVPDKHGV